MGAILALRDVPVAASDPEEWTAVVPAAGRGSRLGSALPKILYPIAGRPIGAWLVDLLAPRCSRVVLVLSPEGRASVAPVATTWSGRVVIAVQEEPRGMGDAVLAARELARTRSTLVLWGDQVTLREETLDALMSLHAGREGARLTLATVMRPEPYIHFERDSDGRIVRVFQRRDEAIPADPGENDCGVFAFDTRALFDELDAARAAHTAGELNLLPLFPRFERGPHAVATVRIDDVAETLGVNTREEADRASQLLTSRHQNAQRTGK
jgi:bifunctional UDP-N-acetylglucosamine pyrophosphorylase/glucosamine-1-phosphate N-acetyltransferase